MIRNVFITKYTSKNNIIPPMIRNIALFPCVSQTPLPTMLLPTGLDLVEMASSYTYFV
jgi:hypothetical protein